MYLGIVIYKLLIQSNTIGNVAPYKSSLRVMTKLHLYCSFENALFKTKIELQLNPRATHNYVINQGQYQPFTFKLSLYNLMCLAK